MDKIKKALETEQWQSFYELNAPKEKTLFEPVLDKPKPPVADILPIARKLGYDVCIYPDSQYSQRIKRLGVSARKLERVKSDLLNKNLIKEISLGQSLFLIPTPKLYDLMGLESSYKRNVSDIHSFLVLLTQKLIEPNPLIQSIKPEAFLGDSNSTVDLLVCMKDGQRWAYEITLNCGNVSANAAKLQDKGFSQIVFVCQDYSFKEAVWAKLRNAGFNPDFLATIRCTIFSALIRQRKQMKLKGN